MRGRKQKRGGETAVAHPAVVVHVPRDERRTEAVIELCRAVVALVEGDRPQVTIRDVHISGVETAIRIGGNS